MPRARQTCTRCSMRRQKCDKKQPCTRCVQAGEGHECTRTWPGGYDPRVHRSYPKNNGPGRHADSSPGTDWAHRSNESSDKPASERNEDYAKTWISDRCTSVFPEEGYVTRASDPYIQQFGVDHDHREVDHYARFRRQEVLYLQRSLPDKQKLWWLLSYHESSLLWCHNVVHGPTFRKDVEDALERGDGSVEFEHHDMKWCALLFAILTTSLTCAPIEQARDWGFNEEQKASSGRRWHEAATECLVLGEYASKPSVWSVQTIQVLAFSSHIWGLSNQQFVMFGSSIRVAQTLGLQRLPLQPDTGLEEVSAEVLTKRETGRRIWWNLAIQDWFSICSCDMFTIPPNQFQSPRPRPYDITCQEDAALVEYTNHLIDVATVMVEFHVASLACTDDASRYQEVLKHDARLRHLDAQPICSGKTAPWLTWARSVSRICTAHKTIILHRHFLGKSLRDPVYAFTRWASVNAAKVIIREVQVGAKDPTRPLIWNDQAHTTGAAVTLRLDMINRSSNDPEVADYRTLIDNAMTVLDSAKESVLGQRGHRLLESMLKKTHSEVSQRAVTNAFNCVSNQSDAAAWPLTPPMGLSGEVAEIHRTAGRGVHATHGTSAPQATHSALANEVLPDPQSQTDAVAVTPEQPSVDAVMHGADMGLDYASTDALLNDTSWAEIMAEFFPDQLGFGNALDFADINSILPR